MCPLLAHTFIVYTQTHTHTKIKLHSNPAHKFENVGELKENREKSARARKRETKCNE